MGGSPDIPEQKIPAPKVVRLPTQEDPNADKQRLAWRKRREAAAGRRSTIMSESLRDMTGSTGRYLGGGT